MPTSAELLLDTSAAVPFLLTTHEAHATTYAALRPHQLGLAGHAAFETFSVITRLPGTARVSPPSAARILKHNFPHAAHLSAKRAASLLTDLAGYAVSGGAVYDALVGAAAAEHGRTLATRDRRAASTYAAIGVDVMLLR